MCCQDKHCEEYRTFARGQSLITRWGQEETGLPTGEANTVVQGKDGYLWIGSYGGLIRYDFTPKPAFNVIRNLFEKEWRTNLKLHASSNSLSFKGFYGQYELKITVGGQQYKRYIHLSKERNNQFTITL